jgi:hypothetical protein
LRGNDLPAAQQQSGVLELHGLLQSLAEHGGDPGCIALGAIQGLADLPHRHPVIVPAAVEDPVDQALKLQV